MSNDRKIRFLGYTIPTLPANLLPIGPADGPLVMAGSYLGHSDVAVDIAARIAVLKNAVETAKARLPKGEDPGSVINLFLAPEFFFRGTQGAYIFSDGAADPADAILRQLVATFPASEYPNWSFVFGTVPTVQVDDFERVCAANPTIVRNAVVESLARQWQAADGPLQGVVFKLLSSFLTSCQSYPSLEVRDRALIVSNIPLDTPTRILGTRTMTTEKYYDSGEDYILYEVTGRHGVVTEQMTAYPFIDLSRGDLKESAYDMHAIFRQSCGNGDSRSVAFGIEICLDHFDGRLRRNLDHEPRAGNPLHVQLIPSCGIQINQPGVAVDANGFVFNCDGQYALDDTVNAQQGVQDGVQCIYANYFLDGDKNSDYAGHTQLARVQEPAKGEALNRSSSNATFRTLDAGAITIVPVRAVPHLDESFAGGPGEVHIYGLDSPFVLYP